MATNFNQTSTCFTFASPSSLRIFNADPLAEKLRLFPRIVKEKTDSGGTRPKNQSESENPHLQNLSQFTPRESIIFAQMLHRSNYVALVSSWNPNSVVIWDDAKATVVLEYCEASRIKNVSLRYDRVIITLLTKVKVYSFHPTTPTLLYTFPTLTNDDAIIALAPYPSHADSYVTLAFQGRTSQGHVQYCQIPIGPVLLDAQKPIKYPSISLIAAHSTPIKSIAISRIGTLLCTASTSGTLVRVFDTTTRQLVHEFRRGSEPATVYSINFSLDDRWVCVGSDRGTVHVFGLNTNGFQNTTAQIDTTEREIQLAGNQQATVVVKRTASALGTRKDALHGGVGSASVLRQAYNPAPQHQQQHHHRNHHQTHKNSGVINSAPSSIASGAVSTAAGQNFANNESIAVSRKTVSSSSSRSSAKPSNNRTSSLNFLAPLNKYFSSQWSFAQCSVAPGVKFVCTFGVSDPDLWKLKEGIRKAVDGLKQADAAKKFEHLSNLDETNTDALTGGFLIREAEPTSEVDAEISERLHWSPKAAIPATSIIVVSQDGTYYKFALDIDKGGDCALERIFNLQSDDMGDSMGFGQQQAGETGVLNINFGISIRL
ncbi:WD repeat domain phosphoinositide-interacting protein 3 [Physocladia obscura]|uniref:WD repeat domain phosphoinositide-interacting protein 3 n=1 Tax=Physocladia obscura TaxID=109957 RepID=A0AAD5SQ33_9FUNG|nr:WD repeat domain phosphoinositide-interacting protein 3 [Physocladia obscura]